jgi:hypothetical protein
VREPTGFSVPIRVYQLSEPATYLIIEDLFYADSVHAFITHKRIKLLFQ